MKLPDVNLSLDLWFIVTLVNITVIFFSILKSHYYRSIIQIHYRFFHFFYVRFWEVSIFFRNIIARSEFLTKILYKNIAIIAIQHSNMYFVDTSGDFSHTVGMWRVVINIHVEGSNYHTVW